MAKPWQPPTGRLSIKSRPFSEVVKDVRHCAWAIIRLRPTLPGQTQNFIAWPLGSGFFVAPKIFVTCNHVMNSARLPHQSGDRYLLFQSLGGTTAKLSPQFALEIGSDLYLFPDRDAAIIRTDWDAQPYVALGYADTHEGEDIGVVGYPLAQFIPGQSGGQPILNATFRVAKGVVTSVIRQKLNPAPDPQTADLNTIEVNFLFVPGNSGGPIFEAETGRVIAYVHGYKDSQIVQRFVDTNQDNKNAGAPDKHIQALHAVYSIGVRMDAIRSELEGFGVTL